MKEKLYERHSCSKLHWINCGFCPKWELDCSIAFGGISMNKSLIKRAYTNLVKYETLLEKRRNVLRTKELDAEIDENRVILHGLLNLMNGDAK